MSSDETAKIEPTLTDAASIAPETKPEPAKGEADAPKVEAAPEIKIEAKAEPAKTEPKIEPRSEKAEAPTLPPAPQIEPPKAVVPFRRPEGKTEQPAAPPRTSTRFALLAACVAIAASLGAIGGSLGVAKVGALVAPKAVHVAAVKDTTSDELKSVKDSIAQLRAHMKSLTDNVAALKTTVNATTAAASQQGSKITEALERIEKVQAEQKKLAAQPAPVASTTEVTGSITQKQQATAVPMVLGDQPTTLKPPVLHDYVLRRVYDGAALIEGRQGIIEVEAGIAVPGLGRIEAIKRQDGRWVVVTARGLIVQR
jgi:hypothetical protein